MSKVKVRGASVEVRSVAITRNLLKQLRVLREVPNKFVGLLDGDKKRLDLIEAKISGEGATEEEVKEAKGLMDKLRDNPIGHLRPEYVVGWIAGSVFGEDGEGKRFILFSCEEDAYLYPVSEDLKKHIPTWCKQIYIGY